MPENRNSLPIEELGRLIVKRRGSRGIRAAAADADVSPATLSRVENGHMPDLVNFANICRWLEVDPADFLGISPQQGTEPLAVVHFRKQRTVSTETARSLGELILAAQREKEARLALMRERSGAKGV
ncbi:MAG: helix-turn-helix transcriptional regulator [Proteobacteria bacterium]|nr:helix-turn-helix transcriptional regulator [Pseudomonadota bacterium]